jgi:hypothetical protein
MRFRIHLFMNDPEFLHPLDAWYQIEACGEFPNSRAGVVQVIDGAAVDSIVNNFNREADAQSNYPGMLIDIDHFKHDDDKETRAYGWLMRLRNNHGVLEGQIRWTTSGREAVDGGDYRYFSTEYAKDDMQTIGNSKPPRVRPLRLDGLTLTNMPNNQGASPITNRILNRQLNSPSDMKTTLEAPEITEQANPGQAKLLAQQLAATTGRSFSDCWNSVRNSHPGLFGLESRETLANRQQSESNARAESALVRNRSHAASLGSAALGDGLTLTQRYHMGNYSAEPSGPRIVNRGPAEPGEITDLVRDFQRENNLPSFSVAWDRAKVRHPEWFFEMA